MRAFAAAVLLAAAAALAAVPSASASPGLRACLPPTDLPASACVYSSGSATCSTFSVRSPPYTACADPVNGILQEVDDLDECSQPGIDVCLLPATEQGTCVLVTAGLQGARACVDLAPLDATVCSTVHVLVVGACPTDLLP